MSVTDPGQAAGPALQEGMDQPEKMPAADFAAWCAHVEGTRGWSGREISRQLGCGVNQVKIWRENGAPRHIALACSAISHGLPPWRFASKAE